MSGQADRQVTGRVDRWTGRWLGGTWMGWWCGCHILPEGTSTSSQFPAMSLALQTTPPKFMKKLNDQLGTTQKTLYSHGQIGLGVAICQTNFISSPVME